MRFHELLMESFDTNLDEYLSELAAYIMHLQYPDFHAIHASLVLSGYAEPITQTTFFRALSHIPKANNGETLGDLYQKAKNGSLFDMGRIQSFTVSLEKAIEFIGGQIHTNNGGTNWPVHRLNSPAKSVTNMFLVYEMTAPCDAIMFSMQGLRKFVENLDGSGAEELRDALSDYFGGGYGSDEEVWLDTSMMKIADVHFYDSESHEEEYPDRY